MGEAFLTIDGEVVDRAELTLPRAIALVRAVSARGSLASVVECRKLEAAELVVFDVEVERPQMPINDIRPVERIAARFTAVDDAAPEALALRDDFPMVPHLNQRDEAKPRSLCLYDRLWAELKPSWTGVSFVERVRWWLARTARGELHEEDQPLEPLMFSHGWDLVVPARFGLSNGPSIQQVRVVLLDGKEGRVLVSDDPKASNRGGQASLVMYIETPARTHGIIQRTPQTLCDLAQMVDVDGFEVVAQLREALRAIPDGIRQDRALRRSLRPIFVLGLPKTRRPGGDVEWVELKGFMCLDALEAVGVALGAWVLHEHQIAHPLVLEDGLDGSGIRLLVLNVVRELTGNRAAAHSGYIDRDRRRIVAIGVGALGSQVAMNLARGGFGDWTLIDYDQFLPHNAVRHALVGRFVVGHNKALCTAFYVNSLTDDHPIAKAIPANYLNPGAHRDQVDEAVREADLILDMSASVPVSRALAASDLPCRAASLFLSPDGMDLVLLAEDAERATRLDDLEMLYYTEVAMRKELAGHLDATKGPKRYGGACRDISVLMPQTAVGTLAGIGATCVMQCTTRDEAHARVWRIDQRTLDVRAVKLTIAPFVKADQHGWRVRMSRDLLERVATWRSDRLPNETGGILLGGVDHERRLVHVVLALPSPPDSEEWPTMYIRGVKGLRQARDRIVEATAGNLDYLGEWHSHPKRSSTRPSEDDRTVFRWISDHMAVDGRPPVMLIAGTGEARVFVAELEETVPEPLCLV